MNSHEAEDSRERSWWPAVRLGLGIAVVLLAFTHRGNLGQNELSRLVAVDALVVHGDLHVDRMPWSQKIAEAGGHRFRALIDMVYNERDGHFYSSKPPVFTLILAAVPALLHRLGAEFSFTDPGSPIALMLLTWVFVGLVTAAAFCAFRWKVGDMLTGVRADLLTVLTLGGTLFLSYSVTINHHTVTAACILFAFLLLGMADSERQVGPGRALGAGLLMGLAAVIDIGHGFIFSITFGLYVLFYLRSRRTVLLFVLGAIPPLLLHSVVQYSVWGTILPVQMIEGTKDYALSYWDHPLGPDAWQIPRSYYWLLTLFSMRGLFVLSPVLLVGVAALGAEIVDALRREREWSERPGWLGAPLPGTGTGYAGLSVAGGILILIYYFSFRAPTNFCGACFGFRWYIGFSPLLALYAAKGFARWRGHRAFRVLFYLLGFFSFLYAVLGMRFTWIGMGEISHPLVQMLHPIRGF